MQALRRTAWRWLWPGLLGLAGVGSALAQGCGPTRLKVTETATLDMTPAKSWALVGDFQDLAWDAETTGVRGTGGNKPEDARRTVTLKSGRTLDETLYRYDAAGMSYAYHVDRVDVAELPIQNASATLEVVRAADGAKSEIRWKFAFYRNLAPGEGAPDAADGKAVEAVKRFLRASLAGFARKADPRT